MPFDIGSIGQAAANTVSQGMLGQAMGLVLEHHNDQRQLKQQNALQQLQIQGQEQLTDYNYNKQMELWHATNYGAQMGELQKAGLNPALLYAKGGPGGQTGIQQGSVSGGQAQQNPGESQALIGMGLQFQNMAAQRDLIKAETEKVKAETQYTQGPQTAATTAQAANLTQGIDNLKAQQALTQAQTEVTQLAKQLTEARTSLTKAQTGLTETQGQLAKGTLDNAIAKFGADTQTSIANARTAMNEAKISDATIQAKITILKEQAIGEGLENVLRRTDNRLKNEQIDAIKQSVQNMISLRQLQWTKEERNALHGVLNQNGVTDDGIGAAIESIITTITKIF